MATVAERISYTDLYARWEKGNWRATEIDFTEDRRQWHEEMTEFERQAALWNYALFFWGEDAVTDGLSPYIDAAPTEEQKYFLATQQVDEARHAVFFNALHARGLRRRRRHRRRRAGRIKPELTWGFRMVFDRLDRMAEELRADPSLPRLSAAITLYHIVIEATLAQPGQHFITSYLHDRDMLPGFREGMDTHRAGRAAPHRVRREAALRGRRARPRVPPRGRRSAPRGPAVDRVGARAAGLGPATTREVFGFKLEDIGRGGRGFARDEDAQRRTADRGAARPADLRLWAAGRDARATTACAWSRAACSARRTARRPGPRDHGGAVRAARCEHRPAASAARVPGTIQWDFADAEPWHLVVANGDTRFEPGRARVADGHVAVPLRGLGRRVREARAPAAPRRHAAAAAQRRLALAVARAAHVPALGVSGFTR